METVEKQKLALIFCGFFSAFLTTRAIASVWKNMRAGQLFFRGNLALSALVTGSTFISSIMLDEEKIINLASIMFEKNQDIVIPIFEQFAFESKEFTLQELKKRDSALLLFFNKNAFDKAAKKMSHIPLKNIDMFIHHPEFKKIIDEFILEAMQLTYEFTQEGTFVQQVVGHLVLGSDKTVTKRFLEKSTNYIKKFKEEIIMPKYEQISEFLQSENFLNMLYDLFAKKEFDETCQEESSVIIEEIPEEIVVD